MERPNPDVVLARVKAEDNHRGKLKIFFGMCPGVGKTYKMLQAAKDQKTAGTDVVIGLIETHQRQETEKLSLFTSIGKPLHNLHICVKGSHLLNWWRMRSPHLEQGDSFLTRPTLENFGDLGNVTCPKVGKDGYFCDVAVLHKCDRKTHQ